MARTALLLVLWAVTSISYAACESRVWPTASLDHATLAEVPAAMRARLLHAANSDLAVPPAPVETLRSAGVVDPQDRQLIATRRAFQDANHAVTLALAYRFSGDARYLQSLSRLFSAWAQVNKPTGHPIDETRLDGLLWAYDAVRCALPAADANTFERWLMTLQEKKAQWQFGPSSQRNNLRTHHLKMRLLLARALNDASLLTALTAEAEAHARINIDETTGASIDYRERDAVHYHNYDMAAWNEIVLLSGCCKARVQRGNEFLADLIERDDLHNEFAGSVASIDQRRAAAGFDYARAGGTFAVEKITPVILTSLAWSLPALPPKVQQIVAAQRDEPRYAFFAIREILWNAAAPKAQR